MCVICDEARSLPKRKALKTIAVAMQNPKNKGLACLDKVIGDIIGEPEPEVDGEKDAAWVEANSWDRVKQ
jgi:hypothetical protein